MKIPKDVLDEKGITWNASTSCFFLGNKKLKLYSRVGQIKKNLSKFFLIAITEFARVENLCQTGKIAIRPLDLFWDEIL